MPRAHPCTFWAQGLCRDSITDAWRCLHAYALDAHLSLRWPWRPHQLSRRHDFNCLTTLDIITLLEQDELKQQAAWKAVEYVKSGMKIGACPLPSLLVL